MSHPEIAARNMVERYVMGKLSVDDATRFEEHFVDCPECLGQLEAAERFRSALKGVAAEAASAGVIREQLPRRWAAWAAAAALLLAAGGSLFFATRYFTAERELEQSRIAARNWQRRYETERAPEAAPRVAATFYLTVTRGADADDSEPVNRVRVLAGARWVALSLEGEVAKDSANVRVRVTDSAGTEVWSAADVRVAPREALSVVMPAEVLAKGDYAIRVETRTAAGGYAAAGRYRFRVVDR